MPTDLTDITWLFIEPQDVLLFRESRPFTAGESLWARSVFPPLPMPFLGALRAKAIVERGVSFDDYGDAVQGRGASEKAKALYEQIGGYDDYGPLRAFGPFPALKDERSVDLYVPVPANLAGRESGDTEFPVRLTPEKDPSWSGIKTNMPRTAAGPLYHWSADEPVGETDRALLRARHLLRYLNDDDPLSWGLDRKLQERERRVGIALGSEGTAREGLLYTVEFIRMLNKDFSEQQRKPTRRAGFVIGLRGAEATGLLDAQTKLLTLGGERRAASYEQVEPTETMETLFSGTPVVETLANEEKKRTRFLLYLATPAVFRNQGWRPDFLSDPDDPTDDFPHSLGDLPEDLSFRLIAASAQKPTSIGGWDLGRGRPRTMYRALPAGAVYVFETSDLMSKSQAERLRDAFHLQPLHSTAPDEDADGTDRDLKRLAQAGLGLTLLGASKAQ